MKMSKINTTYFKDAYNKNTYKYYVKKYFTLR